MSPEQLSGAPIDQRTDFFAIGVMVVEALTGRNPFRRDDPRETVSAILNERAGIDGEDPSRQALDQVLQRCVAKPREQRLASARELQEALIPALASCPEWGPPSLPTNESDPTIGISN
jgi:eukaryotic-like serine/threonine-protein kinase